MSFRLGSKSVTLNDLERRNSLILRYFKEFASFRGALRKRLGPVVENVVVIKVHVRYLIS